MNRPKSRKKAVLNVIGSIAYVACLLQWLWMLLILLPSMVNSPLFKFFSPTMTAPKPVVQQPVAPTGEVPVFLTFIALVVGVAIVVGAIYVMLFKVPRSVARTGEKVTHTAATVISPIIIEHTHLPAKQRRTIPMLIIVVIKLTLVFLPLGLLLFAQGVSAAMSFDLIMLIGIFLFSWAFLAFALQFVLSQLLKVDYKTIR